MHTARDAVRVLHLVAHAFELSSLVAHEGGEFVQLPQLEFHALELAVYHLQGADVWKREAGWKNIEATS